MFTGIMSDIFENSFSSVNIHFIFRSQKYVLRHMNMYSIHSRLFYMNYDYEHFPLRMQRVIRVLIEF